MQNFPLGFRDLPRCATPFHNTLEALQTGLGKNLLFLEAVLFGQKFLSCQKVPLAL